MPRKDAATPRLPPGPREERYLHCKRCGLSHTLNLGPNEDRPMHRCAKLFKAMPFDVDLPGSRAPKAPIKPWVEEKTERRPRIVL